MAAFNGRVRMAGGADDKDKPVNVGLYRPLVDEVRQLRDLDPSSSRSLTAMIEHLIRLGSDVFLDRLAENKRKIAGIENGRTLSKEEFAGALERLKDD